MAEFIEGYSPPTREKTPEDPKDKEALTIRIILMCDGTNNNRANIAEREKFEIGEESASYNNFVDVGHGADSSYDNGRTNIAIMEPHIDVGKEVNGYSVVVKVYVEGQGTLAFHKDDTKGLAFAAGLTGVYQRARKGITDALNDLHNTFLVENPPEKFFIKQVDVDVFGFSRGAATARHAIHVITTEETVTISDPSGYGEQIIVTNQPLFDRLRLKGYSEMRADQVKIIFAGLYDTVVSVAASQLAPAWLANNTRDQQAVAKAKFALHLAAADEHRKDFPLHTIKSSLDAGKGAEYYFPGVHSDVGGSYNLANEQLLEPKQEETEIRQVMFMGSYKACLEKEKDFSGRKTYIDEAVESESGECRLWVYRTVKGSEFLRPTSEVDRVINRGLYSDLEEDKANLIADGWYKEQELTIITNKTASAARVLNPVGVLINRSIHSGVLIANRPAITNGYCNIHLKFMAEHAVLHSIAIKGELNDRIAHIMDEMEKDYPFSAVETALRTYMANSGLKGSKPGDWNDIKTARKNYPDITTFRNLHLHMSCRFKRPDTLGKIIGPLMDPGFTPRFENNLRRRFYYDG